MSRPPDDHQPTSTVVLVSLPGARRKSLRAILNSLPQVRVVGTASGGLTAHALIQHNRSNLIVIDADLPADEVSALIRNVRQAHPTTGTIVLAATARLRDEATMAGADAVVKRAVSVSDLRDALNEARRACRGRHDALSETMTDHPS